ncbi:MAG: hypothetical protein GY853_00560 [PVC group bacterium]|nr:hypothetical protein [PVC group bacterium]
MTHNLICFTFFTLFLISCNNPTNTQNDVDTEGKGKINYLIVANIGLKDIKKLNEFISWKTEKGFNIITNYVNSSVSLEEIDTWVERKYDSLDIKPKFLLLIGDANGSFTVKTQESGFISGIDDFISDLEYGVIGEVTNSNRIPKIHVGRFTIRSIQDLEVQVDKTIWYEKKQFQNSTDIAYLKNALGEAGNKIEAANSFNSTLKYGWDYYFNDTYINPTTGKTNGVNGIRYTCPHEDGINMVQTIQGHVNEGIGFFFYCGNGAVDSLKFPTFTKQDVDNLTNYNKYPIVGVFG